MLLLALYSRCGQQDRAGVTISLDLPRHGGQVPTFLGTMHEVDAAAEVSHEAGIQLFRSHDIRFYGRKYAIDRRWYLGDRLRHQSICHSASASGQNNFNVHSKAELTFVILYVNMLVRPI